MSTDRFSPQTLRHTGTILTVLALLALIILGTWSWQANEAQDRADQAQMTRLAVVELGGKNLSTALDKQRAQFEACKDAKPGMPGCNFPVAPPAKEVAPQIVAGQMGPQGYPGPGPTDAQVAAAVSIYLAANPAPAGKNGTSPDPTTIASQIKSAVVAYLSNNPPADGANGANATDAQIANAVAAYCNANGQCRGTAGQSAYPFTFSFTTTAGLTYTCTLPAVGAPGTCIETPTTTTTTTTTP